MQIRWKVGVVNLGDEYLLKAAPVLQFKDCHGSWVDVVTEEVLEEGGGQGASDYDPAHQPGCFDDGT